jgi:hypothetical protein
MAFFALFFRLNQAGNLAKKPGCGKRHKQYFRNYPGHQKRSSQATRAQLCFAAYILSNPQNNKQKGLVYHIVSTRIPSKCLFQAHKTKLAELNQTAISAGLGRVFDSILNNFSGGSITKINPTNISQPDEVEQDIR